MDKFYGKTPLDEIPWNIETLPNVLIESVDSGKVKPCKTIHLGWVLAIMPFISSAEASTSQELIFTQLL